MLETKHFVARMNCVTSRVFWLAVCLCSVSVLDANAATIHIEPRYLRVNMDVSRTATVMCYLRDGTGGRVPLSGCGFKKYYHNHAWDFDQGPASPSNGTGRYQGNGLQSSDCGITVEVSSSGDSYILGCRVRPAIGGPWQYAAMLLHSTRDASLQFTLHPQSVVVALPGTDVTISGVTSRPLNDCRFGYPRTSSADWVYFNQGPDSPSTSEARYSGAGLASRMCGITLLRVTSERNGFVHAYVSSTAPLANAWNFVEVIVAEAPPHRPLLSVNTRTAHFAVGETLRATCVVANSRPAATLTWLIGNRVVRQDDVNEAPPTPEWRWNHEPQTVVQNLEYTVGVDDNGQALVCQASHAMMAGKRDSHAYVVHVTVEPDCGMQHVSPLIVAGGQAASYGEFPWHAGIYRVTRLRNKKETIKQICSGTLVKPDIVITAAHCVYSESYHKLKPAAGFKVALGKLLRDWHVDLNVPDVQRFDVAAIAIPTHYYGGSDNFRHDVAILRLASRATATRRVQVACIDWDNSFYNVQLAPGSIGTFAGWGLTASGPEPTPTLHWLQLPRVDRTTCHSATPRESQRYLTSDKFCAGFRNRSMGACPGDSGGGLLFRHDATGRFYLRGVASTSLKLNVMSHLCVSDYYTSFTDLKDLVTWIKEYNV